MAQSRKDARGRVLHKGEVQRSSNGRYLYTYTDPLGKRRYIYANDLLSLREKEKKLKEISHCLLWIPSTVFFIRRSSSLSGMTSSERIPRTE